jgi:hypothetical protein
VIGSVEPLLGVLAASGVHQLLSREPSLEELFLAHYGRGPAGERCCGQVLVMAVQRVDRTSL